MILQIHILFLALTILFTFCQNTDAKWIDMYEEINYKDYGLDYSEDNYSPGWNYSGIIPYYKRIRSAERPQLPSRYISPPGYNYNDVYVPPKGNLK